MLTNPENLIKLQQLEYFMSKVSTLLGLKLDASAVSAWAKNPAKPLYSFSEISGTVSQAQLATFISDYLVPSYFTKEQVNALITGLEQFEPVRVDSLPTASAETMYKMFFAPTGTGGAYEVYITAKDDNTYTNVKLNLSDTYTKAEIDALMSIYAKTPVVTKTASDTTAIIEPNKLYLWSEPVATLSVSFMEGTATIVNEYMIQFTCPSNAATEFSLPSDVRWANGEAIEPEAGYTYQVSIVNNLAVFAGWEAAQND